MFFFFLVTAGGARAPSAPPLDPPLLLIHLCHPSIVFGNSLNKHVEIVRERPLHGQFCVVAEEFSDLQCLMNTQLWDSDSNSFSVTGENQPW